MFKILQKTFKTGTVTVPYPAAKPVVSEQFLGRPEFDFARWTYAREAAEACPTGAIRADRDVSVDYGRCVYCGECAAASPDGAVRMTGEFELAARNRDDLVVGPGARRTVLSPEAEGTALKLQAEIERVLGRALAIREVDAGSCNACEMEIVALNNPVHDIERLGIHFVASPRHADMLLVTGPVTRNMETALRKTYNATPEPRVVVAAGACGISGGIFGTNYATRGGVDQVIPVDVYIPGCPPRPEALLHGILVAVGRMEEKSRRT